MTNTRNEDNPAVPRPRSAERIAAQQRSGISVETVLQGKRPDRMPLLHLVQALQKGVISKREGRQAAGVAESLVRYWECAAGAAWSPR
jgi:hypothetical protein